MTVDFGDTNVESSVLVHLSKDQDVGLPFVNDLQIDLEYFASSIGTGSIESAYDHYSGMWWHSDNNGLDEDFAVLHWLVNEHESVLASADALLVQLEVPYETVGRAVELARRHDVVAVFDPAPAPARALPETLSNVSIITPNESETEQLTGIPVTDLSAARHATRDLLRRGAEQVVLKLGERGALVCDAQHRYTHVPAPTINPVDTTAAGDAFTAAMAVAYSRSRELVEAVRFACAAGAAAATRYGAQPSLPSIPDVEYLLNRT